MGSGAEEEEEGDGEGSAAASPLRAVQRGLSPGRGRPPTSRVLLPRVGAHAGRNPAWGGFPSWSLFPLPRRLCFPQGQAPAPLGTAEHPHPGPGRLPSEGTSNASAVACVAALLAHAAPAFRKGTVIPLPSPQAISSALPPPRYSETTPTARLLPSLGLQVGAGAAGGQLLAAPTAPAPCKKGWKKRRGHQDLHATPLEHNNGQFPPLSRPKIASQASFSSCFTFMNKSTHERLIPHSRHFAFHTFQQLKYFPDANVIQKGGRETGGGGIVSPNRR